MSGIATIGIVGAGAMGRGIAELAARQGFAVRLTDARDGAAEAALAAIGTTLDRDVAKGRLGTAEADAIRCRLAPASLADVANADVVVEAIVEDLAAKRSLFAAVEAGAPAGTIIATNTSSLSVAALARDLRDPGRFAGLHFFNPPTRMRIVEIVRGPATSEAAVAALEDVAARLGQHAVRVGDTPGFLVNHLGRGYTGEALRILDEGVATPAALDAIARGALGFRMGPCELLDLTGLDVSAEVTRQVWRGFGEEPRFRLAPIADARVAAGLLGRKSGAGFYAYDAGGRAVGLPPEQDTATPTSVRLVGIPDAYAAEVAALFPAGCAGDDPAAVAVVAPVGTDVATEARRRGLDPVTTVGIDPVFTDVVTVAAGDEGRAAGVAASVRSTGRDAIVVRDGGMPAQRLATMIVLVACDAAGRGLAPPADIDAATRLALAYPLGPLELADRIGPARVAAMAAGFHALTGDPRWRPSRWLDDHIRDDRPLSALPGTGAPPD
jgi:3-hydroxybutyryl-CoA dehydrogenase